MRGKQAEKLLFCIFTDLVWYELAVLAAFALKAYISSVWLKAATGGLWRSSTAREIFWRPSEAGASFGRVALNFTETLLSEANERNCDRGTGPAAKSAKVCRGAGR